MDCQRHQTTHSPHYPLYPQRRRYGGRMISISFPWNQNSFQVSERSERGLIDKKNSRFSTTIKFPAPPSTLRSHPLLLQKTPSVHILSPLCPTSPKFESARKPKPWRSPHTATSQPKTPISLKVCIPRSLIYPRMFTIVFS